MIGQPSQQDGSFREILKLNIAFSAELFTFGIQFYLEMFDTEDAAENI